MSGYDFLGSLYEGVSILLHHKVNENVNFLRKIKQECSHSMMSQYNDRCQGLSSLDTYYLLSLTVPYASVSSRLITS
jgi:hypothetical protein